MKVNLDTWNQQQVDPFFDKLMRQRPNENRLSRKEKQQAQEVLDAKYEIFLKAVKENAPD